MRFLRMHRHEQQRHGFHCQYFENGVEDRTFPFSFSTTMYPNKRRIRYGYTGFNKTTARCSFRIGWRRFGFSGIGTTVVRNSCGTSAVLAEGINRSLSGSAVQRLIEGVTEWLFSNPSSHVPNVAPRKRSRCPPMLAGSSTSARTARVY